MAKSSAAPLKMTEIKELSLPELQQRLRDSLDDLEALHFQLDSGQLPNTARVRTIRRDIARLRTVMREIELGRRKPKGSAA
jgi:large subunit ribosomal protein L29